MRGLSTDTRRPVIRSAVIGERHVPYGAIPGEWVTRFSSKVNPHPHPTAQRTPRPSKTEEGTFCSRGIPRQRLPDPRSEGPDTREAGGAGDEGLSPEQR